MRGSFISTKIASLVCVCSLWHEVESVEVLAAEAAAMGSEEEATQYKRQSSVYLACFVMSVAPCSHLAGMGD